MRDLIEALIIFLKYGNPTYPTTCEHDELWVLIDPNLVSHDDKIRLEELGFDVDEDAGTFHSFKFGG